MQGIRPETEVDSKPTLGILNPSTSLEGLIALIIEFSFIGKHTLTNVYS